YGRAAQGLVRNWWGNPRIPTWRKPKTRPATSQTPFPAWLRPEMVSQYELERRWEEYWSGPHGDIRHPLRPRSYASMEQAKWQRLFERLDADSGRFPFETRLPFLDIRVTRFLLAIPSIPWCQDKHLLRKVLQGVVPDAVRRRPKTPLRVDSF